MQDTENKLKEKTLYAVWRVDKAIMINGIMHDLPLGNYILPVFESITEADEASQNGKFEIKEIKIMKQ